MIAASPNMFRMLSSFWLACRPWFTLSSLYGSSLNLQLKFSSSTVGVLTVGWLVGWALVAGLNAGMGKGWKGWPWGFCRGWPPGGLLGTGDGLTDGARAFGLGSGEEVGAIAGALSGNGG